MEKKRPQLETGKLRVIKETESKVGKSFRNNMISYLAYSEVRERRTNT